VQLAVAQRRVWFIPPDRPWCREVQARAGVASACRTRADLTGSVELDPTPAATVQRLREPLARIAKATNLFRLAARQEAETTGAASMVKVDLWTQHQGEGRWRRVEDGNRPSLRSGDRVALTFHFDGGCPPNDAQCAVDVTALYVDPQWGIHVVYPAVPGMGRLVPGDRDHRIGRVVSGGASGAERIVVIAARAGPFSDFGDLAQPTLAATRGGQQALSRGDMRGLLYRAGFEGGRSRGDSHIPGYDSATVTLLAWETR
jgi:hypothetical protein